MSGGMTRRRIDEIAIGERTRRDIGDLGPLAGSMAELGLLHPIVIRPDNTLIAGERRLAAARRLGWCEIPVNVVDLDAVVRGEYAENTFRKDFTLSEAVAIKRALEPLEKAAAKKRQRESRGRGKKGGQIAPPLRGRAADKVAKATGMARGTLKKAEAIVDAAEAEPERFGKLKEDMDRTGKVDGPHRKLLEARGEKPISKSLSTNQQVAHAVRVQRMMDAGEIEHLTAENRRLSEELKAAHQSNQKPKAANDTVSRIAEIACEIISLDASCSCEFDNKVPWNLLPLMGQASAAWAELTKRLAARVEINKRCHRRPLTMTGGAFPAASWTAPLPHTLNCQPASFANGRRFLSMRVRTCLSPPPPPHRSLATPAASIAAIAE